MGQGCREINCRGEERRKEIVRLFKVDVMSRIKLLPGQEHISCTGDQLENEYYCFSYIDRKDPRKKGVFVCGSHAAKHFLELINKPNIRLFNPLIGEVDNNIPHQLDRRVDVDGERTEVENLVARNLRDAIDVLTIWWNNKIKYPLSDIRAQLNNNMNEEPQFGVIKAVNTIISSDQSECATLKEMNNKLKKKYPNMKEYDFSRLNVILQKRGIKSYFG
ncbi:hypothetical protein [Bacillus subtilis]|uniref:hypothetical protein n=1 Tax=Bacillus subtilis TaxID=1423 RepID=UPI0011E95469|nr:hypothetical protein [Bacillus subtilis]MCY8717020.1 hypothetical protein [Bacillus spizizenii]TYS07598.1 hypothetical protein FZC70_18440 [Bacillus subtilis]TYS22772.1 hypothetical protein FZC71_12660 [Bacillus subtilis]